MEIETVSHKALCRFLETGKAKGLPGDTDRIRNMIAYLTAISGVDELPIPPNYGAHQLTGRAGVWSLTVKRNWRMTFCVNADNAIEDLDLEDYR